MKLQSNLILFYEEQLKNNNNHVNKNEKIFINDEETKKIQETEQIININNFNILKENENKIQETEQIININNVKILKENESKIK